MGNNKPRVGRYRILDDQTPFPRRHVIQIAENGQNTFLVDHFNSNGSLESSLSKGARPTTGPIPRLDDHGLAITFHAKGPNNHPIIVGQVSERWLRSTAVFVAEDDGSTVLDDP